MATLVTGAPLLAFGPPGWLAYAALAVGTVVVVGGALYMERNRTKSKEKTIPRVDTDVMPCRMWSVHAHAQGTDMGGTTKSTLGAPTVVLPSPISILVGAANAHSTYAMLTHSQATIRAGAFAKALAWLSTLPQNGGFLGKKSFEVLGMSGGIRFDIDSFGPSNNFIY